MLIKKEPCRAVAKEFEIPHVSLRRYCLKSKANVDTTVSEENAKTNVKIDQYGYSTRYAVFKQEHKELLVEYILKASRLLFGLNQKEVRQLAFEYATQLNLKMPHGWKENECAGKNWMYSFRRKYPVLSLRKPEATSFGRATSFNRHNVAECFTNYEKALERYKFTPDKSWNLDETGCTTVQKPSRIIAAAGAKQVGAIVSVERGHLVTVCCAISAIGNSVPPLFVFPRVNFKDHFLHGSPPGSIGVAHPSGWMTASNFLVFLRHFVAHVNCTPENRVLLILDNHESHISIEAIDFAQENGIVLLSFPPHCSHRMQPLDRMVYGPFKTHYNVAADAWMKENKGKSMTIYELVGLVGKAFPRVVTHTNIQSGFRATGIYPLDRNIFTDDDYLPSDVTDRPLPDDQRPSSMETSDTTHNAIEENSIFEDTIETVPESSSENPTKSVSGPSKNPLESVPGPACTSIPTPEDIRPFNKASTRKKKNGRRCGKTKILTDTLVRSEIAEKAAKKKEGKKGAKKKQKVVRHLFPTHKTVPLTSDEVEDDFMDFVSDEQDTSDNDQDGEDYEFGTSSDAKVDDYVLLCLRGKKTLHYYVGQGL